MWRRVGADRGEVVQLAAERKHLTDAIKRVAHSAETDLVRRIALHARRAGDEPRTLIQSVLADAGDVAATDSNLRITFAPLSLRHRTVVLAALCAEPGALAPHVLGPRCASAMPA